MHSLTASLLLSIGTVLQACAQENDTVGHDLTPRRAWFTFSERTSVAADPDLRYIYCHHGPRDMLERIPVDDPDRVDTLRFPAALTTWRPTRLGVLAGWTDPLGVHLRERTPDGSRTYTLPARCTGLRIIAASTIGAERLMLDITSADTAVDGLYTFDPASGVLTRTYGPQPMRDLFFDGRLHLCAGQVPTENGGMLIANYADGWDTVQVVTTSVDQFLGGFSKIIAVPADGTAIYFTSNGDRDRSALFRYDRTTKRITEQATDPRVDLLPFGHSLDHAGHPTSVVGLYARTIRVMLDSSWAPDLRRVAAILPGDPSFVATSSDDQRWLVRGLRGGPSTLFLYDRRNGTLRPLCSEQPDAPQQDLAERHAFVVRSFDGTELPVHVYLPHGSDADGDGVPDRPLPTVLYAHGGPWVGIVQWSTPFFWRNYQLLADRGYAVVNYEFRGTSGLGRAMTDKGDKAWRTGMVEDQTAVAHWAIDQGIAARGRIATWGWSFGGYMAMAGPAFHPELYAAGLAMYGISDQVAFARTPFADNAFWHSRVGDPNDHKDLDLLREGSPINAVDTVRASMLLTMGGRDERVPREQMDRMAEALHASGKDVIYLFYPDEGHDYRDPESWISFWAVGEQVLAKALGGRAEPIGHDLDHAGMEWVMGRELVVH